MRRQMLTIATALLLTSVAGSLAEEMTTIDNLEVNVSDIAAGTRVSELMDADITNNDGETIGEVSDAIVSPSDRLTYAIIGVGGFLGIGERMVAIPVDMLQPGKEEDELVRPGATKETLENLPAFEFES